MTSPSAEVQGHSPAERKTVPGKRNVEIIGVEPVGQLRREARLRRHARHGIFGWDYLYRSAPDRRALGRLSRRTWRQGAVAGAGRAQAVAPNGIQLPTGRFASVRPIPSAIIAAPDASRRRRMSAGRAAAPSRMPPAAKATTMSASVLSATDRKPSTTNCSATWPRAGSDELRDEGEEEGCRLRVQRLDQHAFAKRPPRSDRRCGRSAVRGRPVAGGPTGSCGSRARSDRRRRSASAP